MHYIKKPLKPRLHLKTFGKKFVSEKLLSEIFCPVEIHHMSQTTFWKCVVCIGQIRKLFFSNLNTPIHIPYNLFHVPIWRFRFWRVARFIHAYICEIGLFLCSHITVYNLYVCLDIQCYRVHASICTAWSEFVARLAWLSVMCDTSCKLIVQEDEHESEYILLSMVSICAYISMAPWKSHSCCNWWLASSHLLNAWMNAWMHACFELWTM